MFCDILSVMGPQFVQLHLENCYTPLQPVTLWPLTHYPYISTYGVDKKLSKMAGKFS